MGSENGDLQIEDTDEFLSNIKEINDVEFDIPQVDPPSLESVLWEMESEEGSDNTSIHSVQSMSAKFRSMLYHCILQGVSAQTTSAAEKVKAGSPTVITNSLKYISVGTSHGYILTFDLKQNLCWYCYDSNTSDQGAVSALVFNLDSTRLLIGYERGYITMLDASNGNVLRKLPDAHAPQTAVLHLRFTFLNNLALCSDSSGCVFLLSFNRRLGVRTWDSKCIFSGARGEVCVFEPLIRGNNLHFLNNHVLIALATMTKVIIISVRPQLKVYFSQQLPRISTSLPLISWQLVSVGKTFQPVLAWGRGSELNYIRVITHGINNNYIKILPLKCVQLPFTMISLHWLGPRHLALLDTSENLRLVHVRTQRELEVLEIASAGLVYGSAHFKALAVGGGVSEAFSLAGERACYNSLSSRGDQLLVLGTKAVHMVKLRTWQERLLYLSDQGRWAEALNLASDEGHLKEKFTAILLDKYLKNFNQNTADQESLAAAINCCVKLGNIDTLCNDIFEAVSSERGIQEYYYVLLTDHICTGSLQTLSPSVAQLLVAYLEKKDHQLLENVLLSLEVSCLDLHQVLKICKSLKLYNAWIHITTKTIGDYTGPLTEFLANLTPDNHKLGNIMLVYVSSCLAGLGYPTGNIPEGDITRVKNDVLRCLETLHSVSGGKDEGIYPYLRALLKYNTRECLNVVELAFTELEFSGEMGLLQRQRLVHILMKIVTRPDFTESQIINMACFISRLVISNKLDIDDQTLNSVIKSLTDVAGNSLSMRDNADREQAWIDLLNANKLKKIDARHLLKIALSSKCYRVAEVLYENLGDYSSILSCYLKDPIRKTEVFSYILKHVNSSERHIKEQFLENFKQLVSVDCKKTCKIVVEFYPNLVEQMSELLNDDSDLQYDFFKEIVTSELRLSPELAEKHLEQLCERDKSSVFSYIQLGLCRNENALRITRNFDVHQATAWLLETKGEWTEALKLLLQHDMIVEGIGLCIRGAEHLDSVEAQSLWLLILQHKQSKSGPFVRQLLHAAAPHVPPTQLFELVSNANFGDIKGLLQGMLNDYTYDINVLTTTLKLLGKDLYYGLAKTLSSNGTGISISNLTCSLCQKSLIIREVENDESVSIWSCGHCFHSTCVKAAKTQDRCPQCQTRAVVLPAALSKSNPKELSQSDYPEVNVRPDLEGHF